MIHLWFARYGPVFLGLHVLMDDDRVERASEEP